MCHEITTPIAIMDLMAKGKDRVCDAKRIKTVGGVRRASSPRPNLFLFGLAICYLFFSMISCASCI